MNALNAVEYMHNLGLQAKTASALMASAPAATKNKALLGAGPPAARATWRRCRPTTPRIWSVPRPPGWPRPMVDRLKPDAQGAWRPAPRAASSWLPWPMCIGEIMGMKQQPSGIRVGQMRVPHRRVRHDLRKPPECDASKPPACPSRAATPASLRGGSEAIESNKALAELVAQALAEAGLPADARAAGRRPPTAKPWAS